MPLKTDELDSNDNIYQRKYSQCRVAEFKQVLTLANVSVSYLTRLICQRKKTVSQLLAAARQQHLNIALTVNSALCELQKQAPAIYIVTAAPLCLYGCESLPSNIDRNVYKRLLQRSTAACCITATFWSGVGTLQCPVLFSRRLTKLQQ